MKTETTRASFRTTSEIWNLYLRYEKLTRRANDLIANTENGKRLKKAIKLEKSLKKKEATYYTAWYLLTELQLTGIDNDLKYAL